MVDRLVTIASLKSRHTLAEEVMVDVNAFAVGTVYDCVFMQYLGRRGLQFTQDGLDHMCPSPDCKHPSFYRQITEVLNDSNLTQTVSLSTRDSNSLDHFFTTNPTLVQRVSFLPGISDHVIVQIQVSTSA